VFPRDPHKTFLWGPYFPSGRFPLGAWTVNQGATAILSVAGFQFLQTAATARSPLTRLDGGPLPGAGQPQRPAAPIKPLFAALQISLALAGPIAVAIPPAMVEDRQVPLNGRWGAELLVRLPPGKNRCRTWLIVGHREFFAFKPTGKLLHDA